MNPKKHVVICVQEFVCVEVKIIQFLRNRTRQMELDFLRKLNNSETKNQIGLKQEILTILN